MRVVAVVGGFDPLHIGHYEHIRKAKSLGDYLIVIVGRDEVIEKKRGKSVLIPHQKLRMINVLSLPWVDAVVATIDKDGTCAETLKMIRPDVFAKGGDRTPDRMPQNEILACKEIGCEIVYGVGEQLYSSRNVRR